MDKIYESLGLAAGVFVLSGIAVGIYGHCNPSATGISGLQVWIASQSVLTAILLSVLPRRPITYADAKGGRERFDPGVPEGER